VSEKILNGTSAQLGYTVPFTLNVVEHTGQKTNYKTDTLQKLKTTQRRKQDKIHSKTKLPWFSRLYDTRPGNEVGVFYNAPELTQGVKLQETI